MIFLNKRLSKKQLILGYYVCLCRYINNLKYKTFKICIQFGTLQDESTLKLNNHGEKSL